MSGKNYNEATKKAAEKLRAAGSLLEGDALDALLSSLMSLSAEDLETCLNTFGAIEIPIEWTLKGKQTDEHDAD